PQIYTPSLHDALPISLAKLFRSGSLPLKDPNDKACGDNDGHLDHLLPKVAGKTSREDDGNGEEECTHRGAGIPVTANIFLQHAQDRKSTRLNSSHDQI